MSSSATTRSARVDVDFLSGPKPTGTYQEPSEALAAEKALFGSSRLQRWFGRPPQHNCETAKKRPGPDFRGPAFFIPIANVTSVAERSADTAGATSTLQDISQWPHRSKPPAK